MSTQLEADLIGRSQRLLSVVWIAFVVGAGLYILLGTVLVPSGGAGDTESNPPIPVPLHLIFGLLALIELVVILMLPRVLLSQDRLRTAVERGPRVEELGRAGIQNPDSRQRALLSLLKQYFTVMILVWALAESIAIYGLILTLMLRSTTWLYPFAGLGILLLVLRPPRVAVFVDDHRSLLR